MNTNTKKTAKRVLDLQRVLRAVRYHECSGLENLNASKKFRNSARIKPTGELYIFNR